MDRLVVMSRILDNLDRNLVVADWPNELKVCWTIFVIFRIR